MNFAFIFLEVYSHVGGAQTISPCVHDSLYARSCYTTQSARALREVKSGLLVRPTQAIEGQEGLLHRPNSYKDTKP
jgi:hypothetical protein